MPGCLSVDGRLFHIFGPDVDKLQSSIRVCSGNDTGSDVSSAVSDTRWQSSARYGGARP